MRGFARVENAITNRLHQYLACGLCARGRGGYGSKRPGLLRPPGDGLTLHVFLDVAPVKPGEPGYCKIHQLLRPFARKVASEASADVDRAHRLARDVCEQGSGLFVFALLEDKLIGAQAEEIAVELKRNPIAMTEPELTGGIEMAFWQLELDLP